MESSLPLGKARIEYAAPHFPLFPFQDYQVLLACKWHQVFAKVWMLWQAWLDHNLARNLGIDDCEDREAHRPCIEVEYRRKIVLFPQNVHVNVRMDLNSMNKVRVVVALGGRVLYVWRHLGSNLSYLYDVPEEEVVGCFIALRKISGYCHTSRKALTKPLTIRRC